MPYIGQTSPSGNEVWNGSAWVVGPNVDIGYGVGVSAPTTNAETGRAVAQTYNANLYQAPTQAPSSYVNGQSAEARYRDMGGTVVPGSAAAGAAPQQNLDEATIRQLFERWRREMAQQAANPGPRRPLPTPVRPGHDVDAFVYPPSYQGPRYPGYRDPAERTPVRPDPGQYGQGGGRWQYPDLYVRPEDRQPGMMYPDVAPPSQNAQRRAPRPWQVNPGVWDSLGGIGQQLALGAAEAEGYDADDYERQINAARPRGRVARQTRTMYRPPTGGYGF